MSKTCKNCGREVVYAEGLQRYNHTDTNYDACSQTFVPNSLSGKRAEPA